MPDREMRRRFMANRLSLGTSISAPSVPFRLRGQAPHAAAHPDEVASGVTDNIIIIISDSARKTAPPSICLLSGCDGRALRPVTSPEVTSERAGLARFQQPYSSQRQSLRCGDWAAWAAQPLSAAPNKGESRKSSIPSAFHTCTAQRGSRGSATG